MYYVAIAQMRSFLSQKLRVAQQEREEATFLKHPFPVWIIPFPVPLPAFKTGFGNQRNGKYLVNKFY